MTLRLLRSRCRLRPAPTSAGTHVRFPGGSPPVPAFLAQAPAGSWTPVFGQGGHPRTFPSRLRDEPASQQQPSGNIHAPTTLREDAQGRSVPQAAEHTCGATRRCPWPPAAGAPVGGRARAGVWMRPTHPVPKNRRDVFVSQCAVGFETTRSKKKQNAL